MKAMILAAGHGKRLRPLTEHTPKPLLQVGHKRLIEYHLENLSRAGIHDIIINCGWLGEQLPAALGNGSHYNVNIQYSLEDSEAFETGGGIFHALPLIKDDLFWVINGDIWTDYPLAHLLQSLGQHLAHLVLVNNPPQHPKGDFGLLDGCVRNDAAERYTFTGISVIHRALFTNCEPGRFPLAPLLRAAADQGQVSGELYAGEWHDVGTLERLSALDQRLTGC